MTIELWCLIAAASVPLFLGWAAGIAKFKAMGMKGVYDRKEVPPLTGWGARAERALMNNLENLPLFAAIVIAGHLAGQQNDVTQISAVVFAAGRGLHALAYVFGLQPWRSVFYSVALVAMIVYGVQLL